ncbi:MAG TPA: hypothetical protein VF221_04205 [Chloroflexota bacterium]
MERFEWAQNNLDVQTPHELQDDRGVQVYFAPNIPSNVRLVNLGTGRVVSFHEGEERPLYGYYAEYDSLQRYTERRGRPLEESGGLVSVL